MPDDSPDSPAPPTVAPPGGDGPPGAVPGPSISGGNAGGGGAPASPATPPMAGPVAQAVPPRGNQRQILTAGSLILQGLNKMLGQLNPGDEMYKDIAKSIERLSKHFPPAPPQGMPQTPPMATRPQGGQPMQPPMMSGGPQAGMAQRGPAAMPA